MKAPALSFSKAPVKFRMYVISSSSSSSLLGFFLFCKIYIYLEFWWGRPTSANLVPIRLDIEIDGQRFKDAFTWNPSGIFHNFHSFSLPLVFFLFAYIYICVCVCVCVCVFLMLTITSAFASLNYTQHLIFFTCQYIYIYIYIL